VPERDGKPREMKLNRKSEAWGLARPAVAELLMGGAGVAVAVTGMTPSTVSSVDPLYGHMGGMDGPRDMEGWRSVRTRRR
jgi:hypothetical protein